MNSTFIKEFRGLSIFATFLQIIQFPSMNSGSDETVLHLRRKFLRQLKIIPRCLDLKQIKELEGMDHPI